MLTKDEADRLEMVIDLMIGTKDFSDDGIKGILKKFIHKITEKPKPEFDIPPIIAANIQRYFKFKEDTPLNSMKIHLLDGDEWATNAELEMRVNQLIETVNKLTTMIEGGGDE